MDLLFFFCGLHRTCRTLEGLMFETLAGKNLVEKVVSKNFLVFARCGKDIVWFLYVFFFRSVIPTILISYYFFHPYIASILVFTE